MDVKFLPVVASASCGSCSLCCKLMAVADLNKPPEVWCPHAKKSCGCGIYADRPQACRDFVCVWLASQKHPPELRPDRIHGVLTSTPKGHLVLHEDPGWPGHARLALRDLLGQWIADGKHYVVVVSGLKRVRKFYGHPSLLPAAREMLDESADLDASPSKIVENT